MTFEDAKTILGITSLCEKDINFGYKKALKLYHPDNKLSKNHSISDVKEAREILTSIAKKMKTIGNSVSVSTDIVDIEDVARLKNKIIDRIVSVNEKIMTLYELNDIEPMMRIHGSINSLNENSEFEVYQRYSYKNEYNIMVDFEIREEYETSDEFTLDFCDKKICFCMNSNDLVIKTVVGYNMAFTIQIHRRVRNNES